MGVSKLKNLVIAALILVNVFFAAVLIKDKADDIKTERMAIANTCAVLEEGGISINPDDISTNSSLRTMRTARDPAAEERIAISVLGPVDKPEQGVTTRYENKKNGTAVFYSEGEFAIDINADIITNANGTLSTVKKLLRSMELETRGLYLSGKPGREYVTAVCAYKKASIFNLTIQFVFEEGSLISVSGRYVTVVEPEPYGTVISSAGTALLGFLAAVRRGDISCTRIDSAEPGYRLRDTGVFGAGALAPVWMLTTDSGNFTFDPENGEIREVPSVYQQGA